MRAPSPAAAADEARLLELAARGELDQLGRESQRLHRVAQDARRTARARGRAGSRCRSRPAARAARPSRRRAARARPAAVRHGPSRSKIVPDGAFALQPTGLRCGGRATGRTSGWTGRTSTGFATPASPWRAGAGTTSGRSTGSSGRLSTGSRPTVPWTWGISPSSASSSTWARRAPASSSRPRRSRRSCNASRATSWRSCAPRPRRRRSTRVMPRTSTRRRPARPPRRRRARPPRTPAPRRSGSSRRRKAGASRSTPRSSRSRRAATPRSRSWIASASRLSSTLGALHPAVAEEPPDNGKPPGEVVEA